MKNHPWGVALALFFCAGLRAPARALGLPGPDAMKTVDDALGKARDANNIYNARKRDFDKLQGLGSRSEVREAEAAMRLAEKKREKAANEAITTITTAYGIAPREDSATVAAGPCEGRRVKWNPRFGERDLDHVYRNSSGKITGESHLDPETRYLGVTWADGDIVIAPEVMFDARFRPGMIAAVIYHETIHFGQITSPLAAKTMTPAAREFAAHMAMGSQRAALGLSQGELDFIEARLKDSLEHNLKDPNANMIGIVSLETDAPGADPADGEAAFLNGVQRGAPLSKSAQDLFLKQELAAVEEWLKDPEYLAYREQVAEKERREYVEYLRDQEERAAEEARRHAHFEDMKRRWNYLREMTALVCSDPDAVEAMARQGQVPGVVIGDLDLDWEMTRSDSSGGQERPVVNACQAFILRGIMGAGRLVSGADILAWRREYRREHPTFLDRLAGSLGDFFRARDAAPRNPGRDSGRSSRPERPERERPERRSRQAPDNWSSLQDLRGFRKF